MDDKIKQLLQDLGTAINESISGSDDVNQHIQRIRDEGYDLYVVLDATIGLNKQEPRAGDDAEVAVPRDAAEGSAVPHQRERSRAAPRPSASTRPAR